MVTEKWGQHRTHSLPGEGFSQVPVYFSFHYFQKEPHVQISTLRSICARSLSLLNVTHCSGLTPSKSAALVRPALVTGSSNSLRSFCADVSRRAGNGNSTCDSGYARRQALCQVHADQPWEALLPSSPSLQRPWTAARPIWEHEPRLFPFKFLHILGQQFPKPCQKYLMRGTISGPAPGILNQRLWPQQHVFLRHWVTLMP